MKHFYLLVGAVLLFTIQTQSQIAQDSMYFWKSGTLLGRQSIKPADLDSITFTRPTAIIATVTIGTQVWTAKNLDVTTYRNGDVIPQVTDPTQWATLKTGAWCYYNNDSANGAIYGKLYNWYAVNDPRGLAPTGYHIPSDAEWTTLTTFLGGETVAGGKMKATGTALWSTPNIDATNTSGFTGLPGGFRGNDGWSFVFVGSYGNWWSSSEYDTSVVWGRYLDYDGGNAGRGNTNKEFGFSVRCLRD